MENFLTSFLMVFTAEMGDKTQFLVFSLALQYNPFSVLFGAMLAFLVLNAPGVFIGSQASHLMAPKYISILSGGIFLLFGLYMLFQKEEDDGEKKLKRRKSAVLLAFSTIFFGELGDKTQVCSVVLGARFKEFAYVFSGCFIALLAATLLGIFLGSRIQKLLPRVPFKKLAGLIMIITGLITLMPLMKMF